MNRDIHLHIDRLVIDKALLDGIPSAALSEEVESSLAQLLAEQGITGDLSNGGSRAVLEGGAISGTSQLGPEIARAIHTGMSNGGERKP